MPVILPAQVPDHPQAGEDPAVGGPAPHDLGEHGGDRGHREVASAHLGDEGPDPIPPHRRTVGDG